MVTNHKSINPCKPTPSQTPTQFSTLELAKIQLPLGFLFNLTTQELYNPWYSHHLSNIQNHIQTFTCLMSSMLLIMSPWLNIHRWVDIDDLDWNIVWRSWLKYWLTILIEILFDDLTTLLPKSRRFNIFYVILLISVVYRKDVYYLVSSSKLRNN
jgi:hypothetical protein